MALPVAPHLDLPALRPAAPAAGGAGGLASRAGGAVSAEDPFAAARSGGRGIDRRRVLLAAGALVAVAAAAFLARGPLHAFSGAVDRLVHADPVWALGGVAFELLSFTGYVALLWLVAGRRTPRFDLRASWQVTLAGAAATRLLPTAGAGGAALTLWTLRRAGHGGRAGVRTLLTFLVVLYSVFLGTILVAGTVLAVRGDGPVALTALPAAGAAVGIALALAAARFRADRLPAPVRGAAETLGGGVRDALRLVRGGDPRLVGALIWWGFDAAVLWAAFHAAGSPPPLGVLVLGYFVGQVANTVPLPGAASGGMVGALLAFGTPAATAIAAVLAYRAIAVWTPAPAGAAAIAGLRRTVARWAAQDAAGRCAAGARLRAPVAERPALGAAPEPLLTRARDERCELVAA